MPRLSDENQKKLSDRGLVLGFRHEDSLIANQITVLKPLGVSGNNISHIGNFVQLCPDRFEPTPQIIESDAPALEIGYSDTDKKWFVSMSQCGRDSSLALKNSHDCEESAVEDVLDYFFGNPDRMQALAAHYATLAAADGKSRLLLRDHESKTKRASAQQQQRLTDRGLLLRPYSPEHSMSNWIMVLKPVGLPGNYDPSECRMNFGDYEIEAPEVYIYFAPAIGKWVSRMMHYGGGSGSRDFEYEWKTDQEAVDDILDYFFGDPERMIMTYSGREKILHRAEETPCSAATCAPMPDA